jgi:hypothetical protein
MADVGGGGGGAPETMDVDVPGVGKLTLPKEQATKMIAARDAEKAERRVLSERMGAIEAEKAAAETARAKAENDRQAAEHAKKGELDKATELLTKGHREREAKIAGQLRDKALDAAVRAVARVVPAAVPDICDQLRARSRYDFDADAVVVLDAAGQPLKDEAGKPVPVDTWLGSWIEKRPHYLLDGTAAGTGAEGGSKTKPTAKAITEKQLGSMNPMERAKFFEANPEAKVVD